MATGPKIVHKQFNSPIGLYSQSNIQDTLNKHLSNLDNGTVGIDFTNPATGKPTNLANSAVLRMLEEEERNRKGLPKLDPTQLQVVLTTKVRPNRRRFEACWPPQCSPKYQPWDGNKIVKVSKGQKKVVWPPLPETNGYHSPQQHQQSPAFYNNAQQSPQPQSPPQSQPQYQPPYQPPPQEPAYLPQSQPQYQAPRYQQPQYYQQPQAGYQAPQSQPAYCEGKRQQACGLSKLIPVGPGVTAAVGRPASPYLPGPPSPQPYRPQQSRWAPVPAPLSPQLTSQQPSYTQQSSPQPQYSPQYSEPAYQPPQRQFEPPPTTITLRQQQPVHQKPPPVFSSQPATTSFQGGVNMRGDQKWPPQLVKEAVELENEARRQLAKGPACRPRKVKKDYQTFFAKHALSHNYPGYRAPPGTQHYEDFSGRSSY